MSRWDLPSPLRRPVDPQEIDGRSIALLLVADDDAGEDDCTVFHGHGRWDGHDLTIVWDSGEPPLSIRTEWLARLRPVTAEVRDALDDAEFFLPLFLDRFRDITREKD